MRKNLLKARAPISRPLIYFLSLLIVTFATAQEDKINGLVTDANTGDAIPGATVMVEGTTNGTITDMDGKFAIKASPGDQLKISFVGFITEVVFVGDKTNFDISLEEDVQSLEEVVVVGYGTVEKSDLTGSVASIDMEEAKKLATVDVAQTIQGRVAGVQVTSNSGAPGTGTSIRVRGVGSFANADPLYVVDGFLTGDISNLSPNDIASMEILKDASATAIYGSRGSNGVVIITTKKGTDKKLQVEINAYAGIQKAWKTLDLLSAEDYALMYLESLGGPGTTSLTVIDVSDKRSWIKDALSGKIEGTDWQEEVLQNGIIQNYDLSFRGSTGGLNYKVAGTFFDQEGIVKNTYGKRYQGQASLTYDFADRFSISAGAKYSINDYINYNQDTYSSVLGTALRKDPINPVRDEITGHWDRTGLTDIANPARLMYEQQFKTSEAVRIQPNLSISVDILDGLVFKSSVMYDNRVVNSNNLTPPNTTVQSRVLDSEGNPAISPNESIDNEIFIQTENNLQVLQNTNTLSYQKTFDKHKINTVVGFETYQEDTDYREDQIYTDSASNLYYQERDYNLMSYFVRGVYTYDGRYLLTATVRRDGSSKFPENDRWGTFPSFSLGWNVDREAFFPEDFFISGLKLRGGWGQVGNQAPIAPYTFRSVLSPYWSYPFDNLNASNGYASTFLAASTITWERSEMTNVGLDALFMDDRLSITAEYYVKDTEDLLVDKDFMPTPIFSGAKTPSTNAATMTNQGWEFALDYKQYLGDFNFNIGGNISFVDNEVTALGAGESIVGANYEPKIGMPVTRTTVGKEFGTFYGLKTMGIFQTQEEIDSYLPEGGDIPIQRNASPGDIKYQDSNRDGVITEADAVELGSAIPDFTYGFYLSTDYKAFDLSITFAGTKGNEIANIFTYYIGGSNAQDNNLVESRLDRWTGPGTSNDQPRLTTENTQNDLFSDRYIEDGSFLRIRNIQLGYSMPSGLLERLKISGLRLYLSADNLLTITNYSGLDPEIGLPYGDPFASGVDLGNYPQARTIILGTNIKF